MGVCGDECVPSAIGFCGSRNGMKAMCSVCCMMARWMPSVKVNVSVVRTKEYASG